MTRRIQPGAIVVVILLVIFFYLGFQKGIISSQGIIFFLVLIPSIILHEVSHGLVALAFGDPTAKEAKRLTLNPLRHVDPLGTVIVPVLLIILTHSAFGWAKPVPVNVSRLRSPRNQGVIVSLAGPLVNILIAVIAGLVLHFSLSTSQISTAASNGGFSWVNVVIMLGVANIVLATFNLLPIPPLDGSAVIERFLPLRLWEPYLRLRSYALIIVFLIIFFIPGAIQAILVPVINFWFSLFL